MRHRYTSISRLGGLWLTTGHTAEIFCGWWWNSRRQTLYVRRGKVTCTWRAAELTPDVCRHVLVDLLPDIAMGMARQIEQLEG